MEGILEHDNFSEPAPDALALAAACRDITARFSWVVDSESSEDEH